MNKTEKCMAARDYHNKGYNCAQSLLAAFHTEMGLSVEQCFALAGGLGGGMRCGSICGAISGGILVLGMLFSGGKKEVTQRTQEYISRFRNRFKDIDCPNLLKNRSLQTTPMVQQLGVTDHCGILIVSAAEILCDYISELKEE